MDLTLLLLIIGGAVALVALGIGAFTYRLRLDQAARRRELTAEAAAETGTSDTGVEERAEVAPRRSREAIDGEVEVDDVVVVEPEPEVVQTPEDPGSRLVRLRRRLAGSNNALGRGLLRLLSADRIDEDTWEDFEDTLLTADLGVGPTTELVDALRAKLRVEGVADASKARETLRAELVRLLDPGADRSLGTVASAEHPAVVMVVGVNGTGKTTTVGKLARVLVAEDKDVILGAADTFRAAAAEQLATWGERVGVATVKGAEGADPASVAFEAVKAGIDGDVDVVVIDTAGRLHTKTGLMDELGKVKRVISKVAPVTEVLLVIDATTGQNGLTQARIFAEAVEVTGIVLTKLDGSAKGGIVVQVQRELGVPVKLVGLGEGPDDLAPFDPDMFVDALLTA